MAKLTDKQQRFIEEYVIDFNATRAYVAAGYSPNKAYTIASKLLKKPAIAQEIEKKKKELTEKARLSKEEIAEKLAKVIDKFLLDGFATNAALRAIEIYNKMHGYNEVEKSETKQTITLKIVKQK